MYLATLDCRIGSECFTIISMSYKEMIVNMHVKTPLKLALCKLFLSVIPRHNLQNTKTFVTFIPYSDDVCCYCGEKYYGCNQEGCSFLSATIAGVLAHKRSGKILKKSILYKNNLTLAKNGLTKKRISRIRPAVSDEIGCIHYIVSCIVLH